METLSTKEHSSVESTNIKNLFNHLNKHIINQENLLKKILITCLCDGHLLVEGAPGLAKTKAIKTFAGHIDANFHRIQFTPDLLPADITGTEIYHPETTSFSFEKGPIFHNIILADEVNRAPAKVQSAMLEAMAERQVTIGKKTYNLPELFMVMATQNPIEQEGTYPLPEAQLDRFFMHVNVDYPDQESELKILRTVHQENINIFNKKLEYHYKINQQDIKNIKQQILNIHLNENLEKYIVRLITATRNISNYKKDLHEYIEYGASPRATIALAHAARAQAWLDGRDYVIPDDIKQLAPDILRHRIGFSFILETHNLTKDQCIQEILSLVAIP